MKFISRKYLPSKSMPAQHMLPLQKNLPVQNMPSLQKDPLAQSIPPSQRNPPVQGTPSSSEELPRYGMPPWRGTSPVRRLPAARRTMAGMSMVELVVAVPVLLAVGMGLVQFIMVYHARQSAEYALQEAARAGAVDHARPEAMLKGLARGLVPWKYGATSMTDKLALELAEYARLQATMASGNTVAQTAVGVAVTDTLFDLKQLSPSTESFEDWAQPRLNEARGVIDRQEVEIPNDNLDNRREKTQPASGVAGYRGREPIGTRSGQTLADANMLRLEMTYGVKLKVPGISALVLKSLKHWHGCDSVVGLAGNVARQDDRCRYYLAGFIPVQTVATVRMMSPAWRSPLVQAAVPSAIAGSQGVSLGAGTLRPLPERRPTTVTTGAAPRPDGLAFTRPVETEPVRWGNGSAPVAVGHVEGDATGGATSTAGTADAAAAGQGEGNATPAPQRLTDDVFFKPPQASSSTAPDPLKQAVQDFTGHKAQGVTGTGAAGATGDAAHPALCTAADGMPGEGDANGVGRKGVPREGAARKAATGKA